MRTLNTLSVPDDTYATIEKLAKVRGVTVAELAMAYIVKGLGMDDPEEKKILAEAAVERDRLEQQGVFINDEDVREGKAWGRK